MIHVHQTADNAVGEEDTAGQGDEGDGGLRDWPG